MVGQEHHGPSVRWHLHRPEHHALAGDLVGAGARQRCAVQTKADPVGVRRHCVRRATQEVERVTVDPVGARSDPDAQRSGRRWPGGVQGRRRPGRRPDREHVPFRDGRRADPGERVGGSRPEHRLDRDPTGHRDVGAQPGRRRTEDQLGPGRPPHRGREVARAAVHPHLARCTGHRDPAGTIGRHRQPAQEHLETGVVAAVPQQAVGQRRGRSVECAGTRHPEMRPSGAAPVLDQHRRTDGAHRHQNVAHRLTNLTRVPGASSAGSFREASQSTVSVRPMIRQPPGDSPG